VKTTVAALVFVRLRARGPSKAGPQARQAIAKQTPGAPRTCESDRTLQARVRGPHLPAYAFSNAAMSIFTIPIIAWNTRPDLAGSGSASIFGSTLGVICQDMP
jgi:hypothetical protein